MHALPVQDMPPLDAAPRGPEPTDLVQLAVTLGLLVLVIFVGLLVIAVVRRWLLGLGEKQEHGEDLAELLREYRDLYEEGVITGEEYHRIRAALLEKGSEGAAEARASLRDTIAKRIEAATPGREDGSQPGD